MPTKIFEAAQSVSAPEVFMVRCITQATERTTRCMMPRWYRTVMRDEMKMMLGRIRKAKKAPDLATVSGEATKLPLASIDPTGTSLPTRFPKTNRAPSVPYPRTACTTWFRPSNMATPSGVRSTSSANATCSPRPHPTSFHEIWVRFEDRAQATAIKRPSPTSARRRASIIMNQVPRSRRSHRGVLCPARG